MGSPVLIIFKRSNHHENRDFKRAIFAEGADGSTVPVVENASPLIGSTIKMSMFIGSTKIWRKTRKARVMESCSRSYVDRLTLERTGHQNKVLYNYLTKKAYVCFFTINWTKLSNRFTILDQSCEFPKFFHFSPA